MQLQVLVHGEANEMGRLKAALIREYEDDPEYDIEVHNPANTKAVTLYFRGEKMAKVSVTFKAMKLLVHLISLICGSEIMKSVC